MPQMFLRAPKRKISVSRGEGRARARLVANKRADHSMPYMGMVRSDIKKRQISDPFAGFYGGSPDLAILEPRLPFNRLVEVGKANSALSQCIDAYVVNIESYGYQLEYTGTKKRGGELGKGAEQKNTAINFLDNINGELSLRTIRERVRRDKEYTGNGYMEIGRDLAGRITFLDHVPAITMRKTKKDKESTKYTMPIRTADGKIVQREWSKNFCRYVQVTATGAKQYFKEFGDPRSIDPKTGKVDNTLAIEDQASEIYHDALYSPGETYGVPRWLGAMPAMLGLRESELVNLNFFRENAIPAMAVLISGGALTEESFEKVQTLFTSARGSEAMNKILILEAAADDSVGNVDQAPPVPKIDMKPMISERQSDGLFKDYENEAKRKVRSSMRLPAIFTGDSEEYTKATAQSGQRIAESQVFFPERSIFDEFMNRWILPTLGITEWRFKTMGPTTYDPESLGTLLDRFARHGAITPNTLVKIANQVLDVQIPMPEGDWGDVPFTYTLGMVAQGAQIEDFEDIFAVMNDATNPALTGDAGGGAGTDTGDGGNAPSGAANDNNAEQRARKRAFKQMLRREIHSITNEIIQAVNDRPLAEAA